MSRDKSADKRYEMEQNIRYKEQAIDELSQEKYHFEQELENFQAHTHQSFQRTSGLYEKMARSGNSQGERELSVEYEVERALRQMVERQYEEVEAYYRNKKNQLEEEIEQLYNERNALPWD